MSLTLAITAFRETQRSDCRWLLESIEPALVSDAVDEVLVVDDGSEDWDETVAVLAELNDPKLNLFHFGTNQCVFGAKIASVCHSTSDWVQLCDSDNIMGIDHLMRVRELTRTGDCNVWYSASYAKPVFDYRHLASDVPYTMREFAGLIGQARFDCLANTGNQCVNRVVFDNLFRRFLGKKTHLEFPSDWLNVPDMPLKDSEDYRQTFNALDSFLLNLFWLRHGGRIHVVPGLEYFHRVTEKKQDSNYNRAPDYKDRFGRHLIQVLGG